MSYDLLYVETLVLFVTNILAVRDCLMINIFVAVINKTDFDEHYLTYCSHDDS